MVGLRVVLKEIQSHWSHRWGQELYSGSLWLESTETHSSEFKCNWSFAVRFRYLMGIQREQNRGPQEGQGEFLEPTGCWLQRDSSNCLPCDPRWVLHFSVSQSKQGDDTVCASVSSIILNGILTMLYLTHSVCSISVSCYYCYCYIFLHYFCAAAPSSFCFLMASTFTVAPESTWLSKF